LGLLEAWLEATARAESPKVVFSSLFPFQAETLFAPPPATVWPPPAAALRIGSPAFATKVRWSAARFAPLPLIETLLLSQRLLADQWLTDSDSACLLRRDRPQSSPYRTTTRTQAAVDRVSRNYEPHSLACVEFESGAGLWALATFEDDSAADEWKDRLRAAFRLLSDTGFGGRRSSGWGQVSKIEISEGTWPGLLFPKLSRRKRDDRAGSNGDATEHWLLSLFVPAGADEVDWAQGSYSVTTRGGYVESSNGSGGSKKLVRMITEGSVLASAKAPKGSAVDVAPEGLGRAAYRAGFALSMTLPAIDYSALAEEAIREGGELEAALDEALRTAAEEDVLSIGAEAAETTTEEFDKAEEELTGQAPAEEAVAEHPPTAEQPREEEPSEIEPTHPAESEEESPAIESEEERVPEATEAKATEEKVEDKTERTEDEPGHEI
jgi:CRISPR type III-A-associated RAMP protein Csm4